MLNREHLSKEHAELDAIAVELIERTRSFEPRTEGLSRLRWRLSHLLMVHLAKEDKLLYPELQRSIAPSARSLATSLSDEMGGLADTYLRFANEWTIEKVEADWPGFGVATRTVMRALRKRIQREEAELYPFLDSAAA